MREILFRGKRDDNGEWALGSLVVANDRINNGKYYILQGESDFSYGDNGERVRIGCFVEVDPETVGQYTGLTDKNGKKIFEGDVLDTDLERKYLIAVFRDGSFMFNCNDGGKDYFDIMVPILPEAQTSYPYGEVIGNIHDNPDSFGGADSD